MHAAIPIQDVTQNVTLRHNSLCCYHFHKSRKNRFGKHR